MLNPTITSTTTTTILLLFFTVQPPVTATTTAFFTPSPTLPTHRHRHTSSPISTTTMTPAAVSSSSSPSPSPRPAFQVSFPLTNDNDALPMPAVGLGTFQVKGEAGYAAVTEALKRGYRHIDTAAVYRNEEDIGRAIKDSTLPRSHLFITTKLAPKDQGQGKAYEALCRSLTALGLEYVDLYLMHWPGTSGLKTEDPRNKELRHQSYHDLQRGVDEGKIKALGVSNFNIRHLQGLLDDPLVRYPPKVNQVECHPMYPQKELRAYCHTHRIILQAYSSLGQADPILREHPVVQAVAEKKKMMQAQVLLRWALEQGIPVLPKTTKPERMEENLAVLNADFGKVGGRGGGLSEEDMKALDGLDCGKKFAWDPKDVA